MQNDIKLFVKRKYKKLFKRWVLIKSGDTMPVVGLIIKNILARKIEDYNGPFGIGHKTAIKDVEEIDMTAIGKKGLRMAFEFVTNYNTDKKKKFAEIIIEGDVLFLADNPAEILMGWKKGKKLPDDVNLQAINAVIRRCLTKAITLSEDINLPPPVPIPFARKEGEGGANKSRYIG